MSVIPTFLDGIYWRTKHYPTSKKLSAHLTALFVDTTFDINWNRKNSQKIAQTPFTLVVSSKPRVLPSVVASCTAALLERSLKEFPLPNILMMLVIPTLKWLSGLQNWVSNWIYNGDNSQQNELSMEGTLPFRSYNSSSFALHLQWTSFFECLGAN